MYKKLVALMLCFVMTFGVVGSFASTTTINDTTVWVQSLDLELLQSQQSDIYDKVNQLLDEMKLNVAYDHQPKVTISAMNNLIEEAMLRIDPKKVAPIMEKYSEIILLYVDQPSATKLDVQVITDQYINFIGGKVLKTLGVNAARIRESVEPIVDLHMIKQGTYNLQTGETIGLASLESTMLHMEKIYRITSSGLNQYAGLRDISVKLHRKITFESPNNFTHVTVTSDVVNKFKASDYELSFISTGYRMDVSAEVLKKTVGDFKVTISPVSAETYSDYTVGDGQLVPLALFNVSIGAPAFKEDILSTLKVPPTDTVLANAAFYAVAQKTTAGWEKVVSDYAVNQLITEVPQNAIIGVFEYKASYPDIQTHWARPAINNLLAANIFTDHGMSNFEPNKVMSRGEFVELLLQIVGKDGASVYNFTDVPSTHQYADIMQHVVYHGFTAGATEGMFYPDAALTREDMAVMLTKMFKTKKGYELEGDFIRFKDMHDISVYAKDAVEALYEEGYISGYADGTFRPKDSVSRAVVASIVDKLLNK